MLIAIEFIGDHEPIDRETLFSHLRQHTDPDKDDQVKADRSGATTNVLTNIEKCMPLVVSDDRYRYSLSDTIAGEYTSLYSGRQIYDALNRDDRDLATQELQTDCLIFYPEMRSIVLFLWRRRQGKRSDLDDAFLGKTVFDVTFNSFTLPATLRFAYLLGLVVRDPVQKGIYRVPRLLPLLLAQLVVEEYAAGTWSDPYVSLDVMSEHFFLKYGMKRPQFLRELESLRLLIPGLIVPGSYHTIALDLDLARRLKLYE